MRYVHYYIRHKFILTGNCHFFDIQLQTNNSYLFIIYSCMFVKFYSRCCLNTINTTKICHCIRYVFLKIIILLLIWMTQIWSSKERSIVTSVYSVTSFNGVVFLGGRAYNGAISGMLLWVSQPEFSRTQYSRRCISCILHVSNLLFNCKKITKNSSEIEKRVII